MANKIVDVEGIGPVNAAKLQAAAYKTTDSYLKACKTPAMRKEVAKKTGISAKLILEWANRCDLMRVKGIGGEYSDLLESAGVDTVKELRKRVPANLAMKFVELNAKKKIVRVVPSEKDVTKWVLAAKKLADGLEY